MDYRRDAFAIIIHSAFNYILNDMPIPDSETGVGTLKLQPPIASRAQLVYHAKYALEFITSSSSDDDAEEVTAGWQPASSLRSLFLRFFEYYPGGQRGAEVMMARRCCRSQLLLPPTAVTAQRATASSENL